MEWKRMAHGLILLFSFNFWIFVSISHSHSQLTILSSIHSLPFLLSMRSLSTLLHLQRSHRPRLTCWTPVLFLMLHFKSRMSSSSSSSSSSSPSTTSAYDTWSREQLIKRIQELESTLEGDDAKKRKATSSPLSLAHTPEKLDATEPLTERKAKRLKKLEHIPTKRIVLKVAYLGWHHHGFASQTHTANTIEAYLFKAIEKSHLCPKLEEAHYDRCGRTDIGVSAIGNVVALNLRSKSTQNSITEEYPYAVILNRLLPPSIRILGWAYAPSEDFSSRFHCTSRTYTYLLPASGLDSQAIQQGLAYLVGEHDFRHFCKIDPNKPERNYHRTIFKTELCPITLWNQPYFMIKIQGSAFLWRQIRYTVHLLTLIGFGLEKPDLILELFNVDQVKARPTYSPASEYPLILTECQFDDLTWHFVDDPKLTWHTLVEQQTKTWIVQFLMQKECRPTTTTCNFDFDGIVLAKEQVAPWMKKWSAVPQQSYKPILQRPVCETVESMARRLEKRLERKSKPASIAEP